jgi:transposase
MESTGIYWKSPYLALLHYAKIVSTVVNARHVKNVPGRKTDMADSLWLAMLGRAGLLRASFVPPAELDALRAISRQKQKLTGELASEKNRLSKILASAGVRLGVVVSDIHGAAARRMAECLISGGTPLEALRFSGKRLKASAEELLDALEGDLTDDHRWLLNEILDHIKELEDRMTRLGDRLIQRLSDLNYGWALNLLQTIPGINIPAAAMLLVEIGVEMDAFGSPERLASWAGLCPGNDETAGKRRSGKIRKGNRWIRRILCEAANAARRSRSMFDGKYKSLVGSRGHKRTIIALAHKILRIIYVLLKKKVCYKDSTINYEKIFVDKKAPRWLKMLKKFGYLEDMKNLSATA